MGGGPVANVKAGLSFRNGGGLTMSGAINFNSETPRTVTLTRGERGAPDMAVDLARSAVRSVVTTRCNGVNRLAMNSDKTCRPSEYAVLRVPFTVGIEVYRCPSLLVEVMFPVYALTIRCSVDNTSDVSTAVDVRALNSGRVALTSRAAGIRASVCMLLGGGRARLNISSAPVNRRAPRAMGVDMSMGSNRGPMGNTDMDVGRVSSAAKDTKKYALGGIPVNTRAVVMATSKCRGCSRAVGISGRGVAFRVGLGGRNRWL